LLEASTQQWRNVAEKQLMIQSIQDILKKLLPEDIRQTARWSNDIPCVEEDIDLRLGRPLTTVPEKLFTLRPRTADDNEMPRITSLAD
jgi:hypothetical protein